jgi:hypothetical protein
MSPTDDLIRKYADQLQDIYDRKTAGAYTFTGVLATFAHELTSLPETPVVRSGRMSTLPPPCRKCGARFIHDTGCSHVPHRPLEQD